jgi:hypothetical protein
VGNKASKKAVDALIDFSVLTAAAGRCAQERPPGRPGEHLRL